MTRSSRTKITKRSYLDVFLSALNLIYLGLWVTYAIVAFVWYSYGSLQAGYLVNLFRSHFDILGFNWETVTSGGFFAVVISRTWTLFDWVWRTISRDFVSLSLLSSIMYLAGRRFRIGNSQRENREEKAKASEERKRQLT